MWLRSILTTGCPGNSGSLRNLPPNARIAPMTLPSAALWPEPPAALGDVVRQAGNHYAGILRIVGFYLPSAVSQEKTWEAASPTAPIW